MKNLYYDCFAGISGDMNLGALIDLGVDPEYLKNELMKLPVKGYSLDISRKTRRGIAGTRVHVVLEAQPELTGHPVAPQNHAPSPDARLSMAAPLSEAPAGHQHATFRSIREMILGSNLNRNVKDLSIAIFRKVAEAEGKVHQQPADDVHFHEVGAVDSIVDIVGAAICIDILAPDRILSSPVELGSGMVHCAHGIFPVPAPATAEILTGIPVKTGAMPFEATTPTGAAILAATVHEFTSNCRFTLLKTGYGIGMKEANVPNVLRVFLCESEEQPAAETVHAVIIECNIDDMNPELYDYVIDAFFSAGAKDVFITPVIMKKSRPAVKLSVLCNPEDELAVNEVFFRETSTLGVRRTVIEKTMLERRMASVHTPHGDIRVKSAYYRGKWIKSKPEYDDCLAAAKAKRIPITQIYRDVEKALGNQSE